MNSASCRSVTRSHPHTQRSGCVSALMPLTRSSCHRPHGQQYGWQRDTTAAAQTPPIHAAKRTSSTDPTGRRPGDRSGELQLVVRYVHGPSRRTHRWARYFLLPANHCTLDRERKFGTLP